MRELLSNSNYLPTNIFDKKYDINKPGFDDWDSSTSDLKAEATGAGQKFKDIIIPTMDT